MISVFDLDYTLYSLPKSIPFNYDLLKKNNKVNNLLKSLSNKKYIFTNGTLLHVFEVLKQLEMTNIFDKIETRDTLKGYKPNINIFNKFIEKCSIKNDDNVMFFEDTLENLEIAKKLNWTTIFICGPYSNFLRNDEYKLKIPDFIDYIFVDIEEALIYFYNIDTTENIR
jgi:FMN phosphatase YigB (HAD superfamily)